MTADLVRSICAEFDVEIIPGNVYPQPGQTRASVTLARIRQRYGEGHLRLVLSTLTETEGADGVIDETSAWAVSDLIRACPQWAEERAGDWLGAWDKLPLGRFMATVQDLRGVTHQRHALAGVCYVFLAAVLGATDATPTKGRRMSNDEKLEIGRELLAKKAALPRGHFGPWLKTESGLSDRMARQCMRLARGASPL